MRVASTAAIFAIAALFANRVLAEDTWYTLKEAEKGFSVEMPAEPQYMHAPGQVDGSSYTIHVYSIKQGTTAYSISTATYPDGINVSDAIKNGLDTAANALEDKKWKTLSWTTYQSQPAVDSLGITQGREARIFSVLKGQQVYTLTYVGDSGTSQSEDAKRFMNSLNINYPSAK